LAQIFISHASRDMVIARAVRACLQGRGHDVSALLLLGDDDRDQVGHWLNRLYNQLQSADTVVCIITAAFTESQWCLAELGIARILGIPLLPLIVEPDVSPDLLRGLWQFDYHAGQWCNTLAGALIDFPDRWTDGSPFPGLAPFDIGMAQVFCGRVDEVRGLIRKLHSVAQGAVGGMLVVVGPSGCGKSSLVRAGVVPRMAKLPGWKVAAPFSPGDDPVKRLAEALAETAHPADPDWNSDEIRRKLNDSDDGLAGLTASLVADRGDLRKRLLLVVDQAEELFTRAEPARRDKFLTLLRKATSVRVVFTIRSEFQDQLLALLKPAEMVSSDGVFALLPLAPDKLSVVIEEPARLARLSIEDGLVERMVTGTGSGEALPLLAFVLQQLADGLEAGDELTLERYEELGGVRGALARCADTALEAASTSGLTPAQIVAWLVRLATLSSSGKPTRRRVDMVQPADPMRPAIDMFVDARLLTTVAEGTDKRVEVTHEALLTAWKPLADEIDKRRVQLFAAQSVERAATEWLEGRKADHFLWDENRLRAALANLGLPTALDKPIKNRIRSAIGNFFAKHLHRSERRDDIT
jgi:hypothetical protein